MRCAALCAALAAFFLLAGQSGAFAWETISPHVTTAYVLGVDEGNIIAVSESARGHEPDYRVSLYGIGIPSGKQPLAAQARQALLRLLPTGGRVVLSIVGRDEHGMVSALVQRNDRSINNFLVDQGLAWVDRSTCKAMFCRRWHIQEHGAIKDRRGIWSLNIASPPWQWGGRAGVPPASGEKHE